MDYSSLNVQGFIISGKPGLVAKKVEPVLENRLKEANVQGVHAQAFAYYFSTLSEEGKLIVPNLTEICSIGCWQDTDIPKKNRLFQVADLVLLNLGPSVYLFASSADYQGKVIAFIAQYPSKLKEVIEDEFSQILGKAGYEIEHTLTQKEIA